MIILKNYYHIHFKLWSKRKKKLICKLLYSTIRWEVQYFYRVKVDDGEARVHCIAKLFQYNFAQLTIEFYH